MEINYFLEQKLKEIENLPFKEFVDLFITLSPYEKHTTMKILFFIAYPNDPKIYDIPNKYYFLFECNQEEYKIKPHNYIFKDLILGELKTIYNDINDTILITITNPKKIAKEFFRNDGNLRITLKEIFEKRPIKNIPKDVLIKNKSKKNFELKFLLKNFATQIFHTLNKMVEIVEVINENEIDKIEKN